MYKHIGHSPQCKLHRFYMGLDGTYLPLAKKRDYQVFFLFFFYFVPTWQNSNKHSACYFVSDVWDSGLKFGYFSKGCELKISNSFVNIYFVLELKIFFLLFKLLWKSKEDTINTKSKILNTLHHSLRLLQLNIPWEILLRKSVFQNQLSSKNAINSFRFWNFFLVAMAKTVRCSIFMLTWLFGCWAKCFPKPLEKDKKSGRKTALYKNETQTSKTSKIAAATTYQLK